VATALVCAVARAAHSRSKRAGGGVGGVWLGAAGGGGEAGQILGGCARVPVAGGAVASGRRPGECMWRAGLSRRRVSL
jgi:hypothetical protein